MNITNRLKLFPITTAVTENKQREQTLTIANCNLAELAERFGTPLYLYDRATLDQRATAYREALATHYPAPSFITYAGKAGLNLALAQWTQTQQLWLDCTGAGELYIAQTAQVPHDKILVHGVNKSEEDLVTAIQQAAVIVVDNLEELARLHQLYTAYPAEKPELWLRIRPGHAVETHAYHQTGQSDSKFGLSPTEAQEAVAFCQTHKLPLMGLHIHQGSGFRDPAPVGPGITVALDLMAQLRDELNWVAQSFSPGGGWGMAYHEDDLPHPDMPKLHIEPGRTLVAQAGVALYRVGAVKQTPQRRWLLLDGGMADNVRPALYGIRYSALPVEQPERDATDKNAWLAGPYCESGDVIIEDLPLPEIQVGEIVAVPMSGAYQLGLGSNYNGGDADSAA